MEPINVANAFYSAFQKRDGDAMGRCYDEGAVFSDPIFHCLDVVKTRWMWRMLCENGRDLKIAFDVIDHDTARVLVDWQAWYTFSKSGRPVHNSVRAEILVKDGKIIDHRDHFDFWRWSRQAIGPAGCLLGWTPMLKHKIRVSARHSLDSFIAKHAGR